MIAQQNLGLFLNEEVDQLYFNFDIRKEESNDLSIAALAGGPDAAAPAAAAPEMFATPAGTAAL